MSGTVRGSLFAALPLALVPAVPAGAAPITVAKTASLVSDPTGNLLPKAVPGAVVDYTVTLTNPASNLLNAASGITLTEAVPPATALRVADIALLSAGPVEFNGGLLGISGLGYSFGGLSSTTDSIEFSADKGVTWTYVPVADGDGYDSRVTNIRIKLSGACASGMSASLRFRVRLR